MSNFTKNHPVGVEVFHADRWVDGQTDRNGEADGHFSQFCEVQKKKGGECSLHPKKNSVKCLYLREMYIYKTWYYLIGVVLTNALFHNEICFCVL
jgi:hypothetical protein